MAFKIQRFIPASPITMPDPDPKDPKNAKREADRLAAKDPKRIYGETIVKRDKDEYGFNRITVSQPYTTSTGSKKTGKSYKQLEKEGGDVEAARKFNAGKSGTRTYSFSYGNAKPAGVQISAKTPKPEIDLSKRPSIKPPSYREIHKAKLDLRKIEHEDWKEEKRLKFIQDRAHKKPYTETERQRDIKIAKKNKNKRKRKNLFSFKLPTIKRSDVTISESMSSYK